jgi:hypothetical protein
VRVERRGARGRGLFAARDLPAGAVVLAALPAALVTTQPELRCGYCLGGALAEPAAEACQPRLQSHSARREAIRRSSSTTRMRPAVTAGSATRGMTVP